MFKVKVTLKDDNLKKLKENAAAMGGERSVSFPELMTDEFMKRYTDFDSLQAMCDAGGVETADDIKSSQFSQFVAEHSQFDGWDAMFKVAAADYYNRQLTKGLE